jgi:hypothetical protein
MRRITADLSVTIRRIREYPWLLLFQSRVVRFRKVSCLIQAMKGGEQPLSPLSWFASIMASLQGFPLAISWRTFGALQRGTHKIRCGQELSNRDSNTETITGINLLLIIRRLSKGNQV